MSEQMKLTDLNIDCLENIFEYLEFGDLLSAASSNKRLNRAANFVFVRERWHRSVCFENIYLSQDRLLSINYHRIKIGDLKTSLQFLRCFGQFVLDLEFILSKQKQYEFDQHVTQYISEYCSESLTMIKIKNGLNEWEDLKKPFSKVGYVTLDGCGVINKNALNILFPTMQTLNASFYGYDNSKSFFVNTSHFPKLKELDITDNAFPFATQPVLNGTTIAQILRLNPQLQSVKIFSFQPHLDSNDFQNAISSLHSVESINLGGSIFSKSNSEAVIHLKSVKTFKINVSGNSVTKILFLFDQLETLELDTLSNQLNADIFDFIGKHPTIRHLKLPVRNLSVMEQTKLAKSLPLLVSISAYGWKIPLNEVKQFLFMFPNLREFNFSITDENAPKGIQMGLNNEWEFTKSLFGTGIIKRIVLNAKNRRHP